MRKGQKRIGVYLQNRQYDEILIIANRLRENPNTIILLAAPDDEKVRLVCTRSNSLKEIDNVDSNILSRQRIKILATDQCLLVHVVSIE